jgi:4a-hydroxytetrahydrobiopterin dehydratase
VFLPGSLGRANQARGPRGGALSSADDDAGRREEHESRPQRFHVEVYVPHEVAEQRIAAVLAAGGTVVDDSDAPSLTVVADQDGNLGVLCVAESPAPD